MGDVVNTNASTWDHGKKKKDDVAGRQMREDKEDEMQDGKRQRDDQERKRWAIKMHLRPNWPACACCH